MGEDYNNCQNCDDIVASDEKLCEACAAFVVATAIFVTGDPRICGRCKDTLRTMLDEAKKKGEG